MARVGLSDTERAGLQLFCQAGLVPFPSEQPSRQRLPFGRILGQCVRLAPFQDLQEVFDPAQKQIIFFKLRPDSLGQKAGLFKGTQRLQGVPREKLGSVRPMDELQALDEEFHVSNPPFSVLHVLPPAQ